MKNADMPAMPHPITRAGNHYPGLSKRETIAMHLMASWINHHGSANNYGFSSAEAAESSVQCADALLKELEK